MLAFCQRWPDLAPVSPSPPSSRNISSPPHLVLCSLSAGHHGCGRDGNDGRRGEPPCDRPPPWRWSSFSIVAIWTHLAAPWTRLAAAWSVCHHRHLLTLNSKICRSCRHYCCCRWNRKKPSWLLHI